MQHRSLAAHYGSRFYEFWQVPVPTRSKQQYYEDVAKYDNSNTGKGARGGRGISQGHDSSPVLVSTGDEDEGPEEHGAAGGSTSNMERQVSPTEMVETRVRNRSLLDVFDVFDDE